LAIACNAHSSDDSSVAHDASPIHVDVGYGLHGLRRRSIIRSVVWRPSVKVSGKSLCGRPEGQPLAEVEEEVHIASVADVYREHADIADRLGSLFRSALSGTGIAEARSRCAADPSPVREALCEVEQERLRRCGGDRLLY
jgi:hypothetical protein